MMSISLKKWIIWNKVNQNRTAPFSNGTIHSYKPIHQYNLCVQDFHKLTSLLPCSSTELKEIQFLLLIENHTSDNLSCHRLDYINKTSGTEISTLWVRTQNDEKNINRGKWTAHLANEKFTLLIETDVFLLKHCRQEIKNLHIELKNIL